MQTGGMVKMREDVTLPQKKARNAPPQWH